MQSVKAQPDSHLKGSSTTLNKPPNNMDDYVKKGKFIIWDLWKNGTNIIHDMLVVNSGAYLYLHNSPEKVLKKSRKGNIVLKYGF